MSDMSTIVNEVTTSVADLVEASEAIKRDALERDEGRRDSMIAIAMAFRGKRKPQQVMAIFCRMQALVSIVNSGAIKKWTLDAKTDDGGICIQMAVYEAAARCPIQFDHADAFFDRETFLDLVLQHSDNEGRA